MATPLVTRVNSVINEYVDYTPSGADVDAGDVVVQSNTLVGIATADIEDGKLGSLAVTDTFRFPKDTGSGEAITAGENVYWDTVALVASDDSSKVYIGKAVAAASTSDTTVDVRLDM